MRESENNKCQSRAGTKKSFFRSKACLRADCLPRSMHDRNWTKWRRVEFIQLQWKSSKRNGQNVVIINNYRHLLLVPVAMHKTTSGRARTRTHTVIQNGKKRDDWILLDLVCITARHPNTWHIPYHVRWAVCEWVLVYCIIKERIRFTRLIWKLTGSCGACDHISHRWRRLCV